MAPTHPGNCNRTLHMHSPPHLACLFWGTDLLVCQQGNR